MVGRRTWTMAQIMWILGEWHRGCKIQELVDRFETAFPNHGRNSLRTGIAYVWDKYSKDPSYNHYFSKTEIAFIMAMKHVVRGNVIKEVLKFFKEEFPQHDWKAYVNELLSIEAAMEKHKRDPQFGVQWQNDEVRFILWHKMRTRSWEELLTTFQIWREREEVTIDSLQYLCWSRHFFHRIEIKEGLEGHYRLHPKGVKELTFDELKDELEDVEWNMTPYQYGDSPPVVQISTKRSRKIDENAEEGQSKKSCVFPEQLLGVNAQGNQGTMRINAISAGTHRSSSNQTGVSRLVTAPQPQRSLPGSSVNPCFQPTVPRVQQQNTREGQMYSSQPAYAPNFNNSTSTMPISLSNPPSSLPPQFSGPRFPFPNITPQKIMVDPGDWSYLIIPLQTGPTGVEQSPRGRQSRIPPRGAASSPNTAPDWPPGDLWNPNPFQPSKHHAGSLSRHHGQSTNTGWREPQLTSPNGFLGIPEMGEDNLRCPNADDPDMLAALNEFGNKQKPLPAVPAPSGMLEAGENELLFQDITVRTGQANLVQLGNLQQPALATPYEFSGICTRKDAQALPHDMYAFAGQAGFNLNGSRLAPASATPGDLPGADGIEEEQLPLPEADLLPMQIRFVPNGNWLDPPAVVAYDFSHDVNTVSAQTGLVPNGNWLDLVSMAPSYSSCSLGMEENRIIFPDINNPPMQASYMPNGNPQEPVEPGRIPNTSGSEDAQTLQPHPGALSAEAVDELWKTIEEVAPGEFQEVLQTRHGQMPYSDVEELSEVIAFTDQEDSQEPALSAAGKPSGCLAVEDQQVFRSDKDTFSDRLGLSIVDAFQQPETANATNRFSFLGTKNQHVSHADLETLPEQHVITKGEDSNAVLPKLEGFEDSEPIIPFDTPSFYCSQDGEFFNPDLDPFSGLGDPGTEYGISDVWPEIGAMGESHISPDVGATPATG